MYLVRRANSGYEVSSWGEDSKPLAVYHISSYCNCPSYRKPCKHQRIVKKHVSLNEPLGQIYDISPANRVVALHSLLESANSQFQNFIIDRRSELCYSQGRKKRNGVSQRRRKRNEITQHQQNVLFYLQVCAVASHLIYISLS